MTTDVSVQSAFVALKPEKLVVAGQSAYVAIIPGTRVSVTSQSAYVALLKTGTTPSPFRRRRIATIVTS